MIFIANDIGSKELLTPLSKRVHCELANLDYGDFIFGGVGPGGEYLNIAVERKTWPDLISSIESKRLQGRQAPGMRVHFDRSYLLIEGEVRNGMGGMLEICRRRGRGGRPQWDALSRSNRGWTWPRVWAAIFSLQEFGEMRVILTRNSGETCDVLNALYRWWQKEYSDHDMFNVVVTGASSGPRLAELTKPTFFRKAMSQFHLLGWKKATAADAEFASMAEACQADEKRWRRVKGIGKELAARIVRVLREGGPDA